jgi:putative heme iron utilization protein
VVGDDLLAGPTCSESFSVGPASIAEAIWEVLMEWGVFTRWLSSRSHAMTQEDVEFELETGLDSACGL